MFNLSLSLKFASNQEQLDSLVKFKSMVLQYLFQNIPSMVRMGCAASPENWRALLRLFLL